VNISVVTAQPYGSHEPDRSSDPARATGRSPGAGEGDLGLRRQQVLDLRQDLLLQQVERVEPRLRRRGVVEAEQGCGPSSGSPSSSISVECPADP
jgi:hypothetical protein